jgi:hypothetical protein
VRGDGGDRKGEQRGGEGGVDLLVVFDLAVAEVVNWPTNVDPAVIAGLSGLVP